MKLNYVLNNNLKKNFLEGGSNKKSKFSLILVAAIIIIIIIVVVVYYLSKSSNNTTESSNVSPTPSNVSPTPSNVSPASPASLASSNLASSNLASLASSNLASLASSNLASSNLASSNLASIASVINYNMIDTTRGDITYNNGNIIGSNQALISTSSEWNSATGVFKVSVDGIYLINASFFINGKSKNVASSNVASSNVASSNIAYNNSRIGLYINGKLRYAIVEGNVISTETLRTYSRVEQLSINDEVSFKMEGGGGLVVYFYNDAASHTNITITKLNVSNYYNLIDNNKTNITYNNGNIIGSNQALTSTSSEWNSTTGVFKTSIGGIYLINASFFINGKSNNSRIGLYINGKFRYALIEGRGVSYETLRTYSRVEQLSINDEVSFKIERGDNIVLYFGNDVSSHTNISITKLN